MPTLALDTTTRAGSVAVLRDEEVLVEYTGAADVPHGTRLPADILRALDTAGVALQEIDLYAVAAGPGAFTALRIGIATIQGFAFAHGRPVVAISSLDALAERVCIDHGHAPGTLVAAWMDAARGEVFAALYEVVKGGGETVLAAVEEPSVGSPDVVLDAWHDRMGGRTVVFTGDGALKYESLVTRVIGRSPLVPSGALAATIARMAQRLARAGAAVRPHEVHPLYVRRPDAEIARDRQTPRRSSHPA